jgi:hypothetical protein
MQCQNPAGAYDADWSAGHAGGGATQSTSLGATAGVDGSVGGDVVGPVEGDGAGSATPVPADPAKLVPALADPEEGGAPTATPAEPVPEAPVRLSLGTATSPVGHTAGTQDAVVDANGALDGGAETEPGPGSEVGAGGEGIDAPPDGADPVPSTRVVPSPEEVELPGPLPLSTAGAEAMPLAPPSPAEGGVTLL